MPRLLAVLLLCPLAALAQVSLKLSLPEAEARWRQHSRELALARAAVDGAEADVRSADRRPNPQVSMNVLSISPWSGYGAGGWQDKKMDTQLRVDQVIERGGKRELRVKEAEARRDAARRDLDDAGRQVLLALQAAYYDLRLAQERRRLSREAAELYGEGLEAGRRRHGAGDISQVDLARLQIDKSRADNEARQAQAELETAQARLAYLLGLERDARQLEAGDDWPPLADQEPAPQPLAERPDVEAARLRLKAAEAARDQARALKTRDVTVGFQLEHNLQNAPTNSYGFGLSVPLFLWHEYEGEIGRAEAELTAARLQYEKARALAVGDVDQARSALQSAQDRRRRLETGLLADARRVARAAEFAYNKGAMGLMDLLDARRTLRQVQLEAAAARADHAKALAACSGEPEAAREKDAGIRLEGERIVLADAAQAAAFGLATARRDMGGSLRLPGRLIWNEDRTVRIFPQLGGRIQRIQAEVGAVVKAGQPLAVLASPDFGLARMEARKARADLQLARQGLVRSKELLAAGVIAQKDWQQAQAEHARAEAEADRAERRLQALGAAGDGGDGSYVLKSPLAGVVVERSLNPGQEIRPEQPAAPLFVVTEPASLWVQLDAGEGDLGALRPGEKFAVEVKQYPGERFEGVIRHVADFVDPASRTIKVRGEVANAGRRLKGEMFVTARIDLPAGQAVQVPAAAVFLVGEQRYVLVEEAPGHYLRRPVQPGPERDGWVEIAAGVEAGEKVMVEGNLNLIRYFKAASAQPKQAAQ